MAEVGGRHERLLYQAWNDPADVVELTTGLIVGADGTGTNEGLYARMLINAKTELRDFYID